MIVSAIRMPLSEVDHLLFHWKFHIGLRNNRKVLRPQRKGTESNQCSFGRRSEVEKYVIHDTQVASKVILDRGVAKKTSIVPFDQSTLPIIPGVCVDKS